MNPSAPGWIDKFGSLTGDRPMPYTDYRGLDSDLRACGFLYGINVGIPATVVPPYPLSQDENAKVNLLAGLSYSYRLARPGGDFASFLATALEFYHKMELAQPNLLQKVFRSGKPASQLEKLLDSRVYLGEPLLSRTFNSTITNMLLPLDLLGFRAYLGGIADPKSHVQELESIVINLIYHALDPRGPGESRKKLLEVFESSRSYLKAQDPFLSDDFPALLSHHRGTDVAGYLLDIAALAVLGQESPKFPRRQKEVFLLGESLGFSESQVEAALRDAENFFRLYEDQVYFLRDALPGAQYYESMARVVDRLIHRNSKRLRKELMESKELMVLLSKSTLKELTPEEKKKVQKQLLDVFKSIPSLAIFLLPGGAVLLPIFIKLVPKLLPSSFDENRVEKP
ncbi:LETM1-related biofilm-associated protein [Robiginitalea marina]|uniref:LETM1-related biofilm-associated protein n=1 Tax=Robiginitalea marina TaxID=2954105 RepID=A0ABT1B074_9FLAO|nr:LETM1-related biofilm-associated protein [Robiginitalea marina]MCO5725354.1 LETM1-related biofilm-associated protein [Robiginitalea marina]